MLQFALNSCRTYVILACLSCVTPSTVHAETVPGLKVLPGFEIHEYSGPTLANDICNLHISREGRIFVTGRGYVRELLDTDRDGTADEVRTILDKLPDIPMGILVEGQTLWLVSGGALAKYDLANLTVKREIVLKIKTGGEHDAHAIRRGPDEKLYLLCGNSAGINSAMVTADISPIRNPIAGGLLQIDPAGRVAIIADGFRNPYDFDFDTSGQPHTYDSDNERCVGLPWYEPCRFYQVRQGGHYGWRNPQLNQTWRAPPYFPDVVAPTATTGRGSPTGCVCYRHTQFPTEYHGGFFLADWTFGTIWFVPKTGQSDEPSSPQKFVEVVQDAGFAPTAMAVHPQTGELYISVGGRGTRGAVYRVKATTAPKTVAPIPMTATPIMKTTWDQTNTSAEFDATSLLGIRRWQLSHGDLTQKPNIGGAFEGYILRETVPPAETKRVSELVRKQLSLPNQSFEMVRELTRTLATIHDPDPASRDWLAERLTPQCQPIDDVHYLIVLARISSAPTPATRAKIAEALLTLDEKYRANTLTRDRHWPLRMQEICTQLIEHDPILIQSILNAPSFGTSSNAWLLKLPKLATESAARRVLNLARNNPQYEWSTETVSLLLKLPPQEVRPLIDRLWSNGGLEESVLKLIEREPTSADRTRVVQSLKLSSATAITRAATILQKLPIGPERDWVEMLRALRKATTPPANAETAKQLGTLLMHSTGQEFGTKTADWEAWLSKTKPELMAQYQTLPPTWQVRKPKIAALIGDAKRGAAVFQKASCAACHNSLQAIGPTLEGVAKRFNRDDLFDSILDPNRDVSNRYQVTEINTIDGKIYLGMIVYEAVDGLLLQTSATETVRILGANIESKKVRSQSLMPAGLLDAMSDADCADLLAYLQTLSPNRP